MKNSYHISEDEIKQEEGWIEKAKKDPAHFDKLYDRYFDGIFNFIFRRTDDEAIAADLCSQTFLAALQNIQKYTFRGLPFSAWLYKIASNQVRKFYRDTQKNVVFSLEESMIGKLFVETDENPNDEKIRVLIHYLKELQTEDMMVLELRFFEEKNFKEIAYILEISESGAKMRTYRALEKLKKLFEAKFGFHEEA